MKNGKEPKKENRPPPETQPEPQPAEPQLQ
jgi:hypothetical protein